MDEIQKNSKQRQETFSQNNGNNVDSKLQKLNQQDDESCWSDSFSKLSDTTPKILPNVIDDSIINIQRNNDQFEQSQLNTKSKTKIDDQSQSLHFSNVLQSKKRDRKQNDDASLTESKKTYHESFTNKDINKSKLTGKFPHDERFTLSHNTLFNFRTCKSKHKISGDLMQYVRVNIQQLAKIKFRLRNFYNKYTIYGRTGRLNQQIRMMINDLSDEFPLVNQFFMEKIINIMLHRFHFLKKMLHIPLINQQSTLGFIIQVVFTFFNSIFLFIFSLIIIFQANKQQNDVFYTVVRLIWAIEIIMKLNTVQYQVSDITDQRKKIFINYLNNKAFFDIFPIIMISFKSNNQIYSIITQILVYFKIPSVYSDLSQIQKKICMLVKRYYIIQLINLVITLFLIGHIIACLWYIIGLIELQILENESTWFGDVRDLDDIWWQYYIWALYWALTLMTTGSNTANSVLQAAFTLFVMLFTTISFGYLLNIIGIILSAMDESKQQKRRDFNIINEYMRQKKISNEGDLI